MKKTKVSHFRLTMDSLKYLIVGKGGWVIPGDDKVRFNLTENGKSWVDVYFIPIPSQKEFETIWNLHPKELGKIKIMGKEIRTPRWQQSYLKSYHFSGIRHTALPLPKEIRPYLDLANAERMELWPKSSGDVENPKRSPAVFTEALLNWYQNGDMYIGPHSDSERDLVTGPNKETLVWSLTLQDQGSLNRTFRLKPKTGGKDRLDIELQNGMVVVMGGECQVTHKHQVPKVKGEGYLRRVNVTFRVFA